MYIKKNKPTNIYLNFTFNLNIRKSNQHISVCLYRMRMYKKKPESNRNLIKSLFYFRLLDTYLK